MPKRLIITKICFHVTAIILFIGIVFIALAAGPLSNILAEVTKAAPSDDQMMGSMMNVLAASMRAYVIITLAFLLGVIIFIEAVVVGLNRRKYWAWIAGIVICGLMILPVLQGGVISAAVGGLALWGLVDPGSVKAFKPIDNAVSDVNQ